MTGGSAAAGVGPESAANPDAPSPAGDGASMVERLWDALREVNDPEIPISLVDLGLIYDLRFRGGTAEVDLTYTATGCPCTELIRWDVAERLQRVAGVEDIRLQEVWSPPWTIDRISPAGARRLRELGISLG
jgi:metal-sulfur cluster biosynthetic enzyme